MPKKMKDVAEKAQVSIATVSRALNNSGYVGANTRKKIMEAIQELNYKPNEVARSLSQSSSKIIGLLIPDIANPYFPMLAKGVEDRTIEKNYMVLFGNAEDSAEREKSYLEFFSQHNVSGILSNSEDLRRDIDEDIPVVLLDRGGKSGYPSVVVDNFKGGQLAAKTVVDHGAKNVLIMVGPRSINLALERLEGAVSVLKEHGISYELFEAESYQAGKADEVAKTLIKTCNSFDTIIANNDVFALAVIKEAAEKGIDIPGELQIIGYDNIPFSEYTIPSLTTISQPGYKVGYEGADLLFALLEGKGVKDKNIVLEPEVILRNTLRERRK